MQTDAKSASKSTVENVVLFPRTVAALGDMVSQHCRSEKRGKAGKPCFLAYTHDFVSSDEVALRLLEDVGSMKRLPETAEWWRFI